MELKELVEYWGPDAFDKGTQIRNEYNNMIFEVNDGMVERARAIAIVGHFGQYRRDGTTPYIKHPEDVANRCSNNNERCVGWLHDIIEDTRILPDALMQVFPEHIVEGVVAISKCYASNEAEYIENLIGCPLAATVKLHDMAHAVHL